MMTVVALENHTTDYNTSCQSKRKNNNNRVDNERQMIVGFVRQALEDLAGSNLLLLDDKTDVDDWLDQTVHWTSSTTAAAATKHTNETAIDKSGKPWNLEVRTAPAVFHRFKKKHSVLTVTSPWGVERTFASAEALGCALLVALEDACRNHVDENVIHCAKSDNNDGGDDDDGDDDGSRYSYRYDSHGAYYYHIRLQRPSGILCIATPSRVQQLLLQKTSKNLFLLPCPYCPAWCKAQVGVRWHVQQKHHAGRYEQAVRDGSDSYSERAIVVYDPKQRSRSRRKRRTQSSSASVVSTPPAVRDNKQNDTTRAAKGDSETCSTVINSLINPMTVTMDDPPWELVKCGDLTGLQHAVAIGRFDPKSELDSKGASALLWAAGGGHLPVVKYLIEQAGCDPNFGQQGKRAFQGRTALHWACRNGHLPVVCYLLSLGWHDDDNKNKRDSTLHVLPKVDIMAVTGDGTSAFHWAAWQNHELILQTMVDVVIATKDEKACHAMVRHVNSYGCNAVLWAAQGDGRPATLQWLQEVGCPLHVVNHSGHGILHKAAQRGRRDVCEWYIQSILRQIEEPTNTMELDFFSLIGPDNDGCLPSDLAGMEEHEELALFLADQEAQMAAYMLESCDQSPPGWINHAPVPSNERIWEPWAGVARLRYICKF